MSTLQMLENEVNDGLLKGLIYNRLVLSKENFSKTHIRKISIISGELEIIEGNDEKNYLIDISKVKWKGVESIKIIEASLKVSGVIKEITFQNNDFLNDFEYSFS